jgi:hypothetical protein
MLVAEMCAGWKKSSSNLRGRLCPHRDSIPGPPARNKSLYRLRYPYPLTKYDIPDRDTRPNLLAYTVYTFLQSKNLLYCWEKTALTIHVNVHKVQIYQRQNKLTGILRATDLRLFIGLSG